MNQYSIGDKVGRLTIIEETHVSHKIAYICKCECGRIKTVFKSDIGKKVLSCGCYGLEKRTKAVTKHGGRYDRLYLVWKTVKTRCHNPKSNSYQYYGARGIGMCAEWENSYAAFKDWANQNGYDPTAKRGDCTLDRINLNEGYSPDNCRWVPMSIQNKNKRAWGEAKREQEHHAV